MSKKLKLAILDDDLRVRTIKHYPVSDSGKHIQVVKGGEGHFMPAFNSETYIELPKKILGRTIGWERLYIAKKGAKACMNFKTETIPLPDIFVFVRGRELVFWPSKNTIFPFFKMNLSEHSAVSPSG